MDKGASLRDRAATPSGPSPTVSGVAGIPSAKDAVLLVEELRGLAIEIHRRCYSHVPQWKPSSSARGLVSQIDNMVAGLRDDLGKLRGAISWIEPPFVDDDTTDAELRKRVGFAVKDARSLKGG